MGGSPGAAVYLSFTSFPCRDHACIQGNQALGRSHQRVDIQFFDPRLFADQVLKRTTNLFQTVQVHRFTAAHALQGGVDAGAFHHAACEGGIERWQSQRAVFEDFDQLSAQAEQNHRAKLRVDAAAQDQLVTFQA